MKNLIKMNVLIFQSTWFFASCGDMTKKVEDKIIELGTKTEKLDSIVKKEFDKVIALDSLIKKSSSKLDSSAKEKINSLKKINNLLN